MYRYSQPSDGHGSLKDIQTLVNEFPGLFTKKIKNTIQIQSTSIKWVSPLKEDDYSEYRDNGSLIKLGLESLKEPLNKFWPKKGPQWDALGIGGSGEVFLVEAKANIAELVSPGTQAKGDSYELIKKSIDATKTYLKIFNKTDWTGTFYQYTNRLAHLYFMRVLNCVPAYLIFVYFTGDESVAGPKTPEEWNAGLNVVKKYLGLGNHKLNEYIADVFISLKEMGM